MFFVTADFCGTQRTEHADSVDSALSWAEEFRYLGGTEISVRDHLGAYEVAVLKEMVRLLMSKSPMSAPLIR